MRDIQLTKFFLFEKDLKISSEAKRHYSYALALHSAKYFPSFNSGSPRKLFIRWCETTYIKFSSLVSFQVTFASESFCYFVINFFWKLEEILRKFLSKFCLYCVSAIKNDYFNLQCYFVSRVCFLSIVIKIGRSNISICCMFEVWVSYFRCKNSWSFIWSNKAHNIHYFTFCTFPTTRQQTEIRFLSDIQWWITKEVVYAIIGCFVAFFIFEET